MRGTSKSWENFDFTNLVFTVDKIQSNKKNNPPPRPRRSAPPAETNLKEQLLKKSSAVLREAQLHKDIVQFMSVYSLTYPGLDDKRAGTLKSWENYEFTNLVFNRGQNSAYRLG